MPGNPPKGGSEKSKLLARIGRPAVEPILQHLRTEPDVTFPIQALREILPQNNLHIAFEAPLFGSARLGPEGDCYIAVVQRGNDEFRMTNDERMTNVE